MQFKSSLVVISQLNSRRNLESYNTPYLVTHYLLSFDTPRFRTNSLFCNVEMSRRVPNPAADRAAQNQQTIKTLLKLEGNKTCADCKRNKRTNKPMSLSTTEDNITRFLLKSFQYIDPRWASWNLGVFVCIRYEWPRRNDDDKA